MIILISIYIKYFLLYPEYINYVITVSILPSILLNLVLI